MKPSAGRRLPRPGRSLGCLLLLATFLGFVACATVPPLETVLRDPIPAAVLRFGEDTFAFPNDERSWNPGKKDLYANYCFVMTRGVVQFFKFARFEPERPKVPPDAYMELVEQVTARGPWEDALPPAARVAIPGYRNLWELSREEPAAVKAGLNARFWTWVHWTNWRVTLPVTGGHQEGVAAEILAELREGRPVQMLITNWPVPEVNHAVVAYEYHLREAEVEFTVYDPNDPARAGLISFQRDARQFWATRLFHTRPGKLRAFRMNYSLFL
jgi:hypothetical protein